MWQPLSTLPPSNAGALSAYTQQQPPVMTPGGGGTGAPLQGGQQQQQLRGLHPLFGMGMVNKRGFGGMFGMGSNAGAMADPNSFLGAMQAWRGDRPQFDMQTMFPNGFDPAAFQQQIGDFRQQFTDWRQARPIRADF